jgi:hypothetical protein
MGGIDTFAAEGATIVVASGDANAAAHALRHLEPAARERLRAVADRLVIEDSTRRVEVISVGRNPHTRDNLMAWLPRERIVYQGDLFYYSPGGDFPPSGRATMNRFFATWLERNGIRPLAIYGTHNSGVAGVEALAASTR